MPRLVPIPDAAQEFGLGASTVRRQLKAGRLRGKRQRTPQGYVWLVELPDAPGDPTSVGEGDAPGAPDGQVTEWVADRAQAADQQGDHTPSPGSPAVAPAPPPELLAELAASREAVSRLEAHNADLRTQAERLTTELDARRQELTDERAAHHQQVQALLVLAGQAALPPPIDVEASGDTPGGQVPGQAAGQVAAQPVPSWWRRALRRLAGG